MDWKFWKREKKKPKLEELIKKKKQKNIPLTFIINKNKIIESYIYHKKLITGNPIGKDVTKLIPDKNIEMKSKRVIDQIIEGKLNEDSYEYKLKEKYYEAHIQKECEEYYSIKITDITKKHKEKEYLEAILSILPGGIYKYNKNKKDIETLKPLELKTKIIKKAIENNQEYIKTTDKEYHIKIIKNEEQYKLLKIEDITKTKKEITKKEKEKYYQKHRITMHNLRNTFTKLQLLIQYTINIHKQIKEECKLENNNQKLSTLLKEIEKYQNLTNEETNVINEMLQKKEKDNIKTEIINITKLLKKQAEIYKLNKKINIKYESKDQDKLYIRGVKPDIENIITNILENAKDELEESTKEYGKNYKPKIKIDIKKEEECVIINITDNGRGIKKENLTKIFEPFYTTKKSNNKRFKGLGTGLNYAKEKIEENNGEITVESKPGKTTFTLTFPKEKYKPKENYNNKDNKINENINNYEYNIVIIEDEDIIKKALKKILKSNYPKSKIYTYSNSHEFYQNEIEKKYDILILDNNLGEGESGLEIAKKLIKKDKKYQNRIIISSGQEYLNTNLTKVNKPYKFNKMIETINDIINKYIITQSKK